MDGSDLNAPTLASEPKFTGLATAEQGDGHLGSLVRMTGSVQSIRGNQQVDGSGGFGADPDFEPVIEIGNREADSLIVGGEQDVSLHVEFAAVEAQTCEEALGLAQGFRIDGNGGHVVGWFGIGFSRVDPPSGGW